MNEPKAPVPTTEPGPQGRWSSFIADPDPQPARALHEVGNPAHRLRVEHNDRTLLIHLSDEDGSGWTVIAVDRPTRAWAVAQHRRQQDAAVQAHRELYAAPPDPHA